MLWSNKDSFKDVEAGSFSLRRVTSLVLVAIPYVVFYGQPVVSSERQPWHPTFGKTANATMPKRFIPLTVLKSWRFQKRLYFRLHGPINTSFLYLKASNLMKTKFNRFTCFFLYAFCSFKLQNTQVWVGPKVSFIHFKQPRKAGSEFTLERRHAVKILLSIEIRSKLMSSELYKSISPQRLCAKAKL